MDLKSTACAAAESFSRDAVKFGYFSQAADYLDAMEVITGEPWTYYWIAAESEPPWLCPCYQCPPEGVDMGRVGRRSALLDWSTATESGVWGGYQKGFHQLLPSAWALKEAGVES